MNFSERKVEYNALKFEELTNKVYHGKSVYNPRIVYDEKLAEGIKIFDNTEEIKEYLKMIR